MNDGRAVFVLSRHWRERASELAYVTRSIAGAASRIGTVTVLVPSSPSCGESDGAFDLVGIGVGAHGGWPTPHAVQWPTWFPKDGTIIVDDLNEAVYALIAHSGKRYQILSISSSPEYCDASASSEIALVGPDVTRERPIVGMHVPINPLAAQHRHNGFGFTGYLLVLSDRTGHHESLPPAAAWLTSQFHDANVLVVEDATASVWRGRALRGIISVDTRMDLWRLIAHARVCVDLAPGPFVARECIEALRFGIPIVVPAGAPAAAAHAAAGGGLTFRDMAELLRCTGQLRDDALRSRMSSVGRSYADTLYGDPSVFVDNLDNALMVKAAGT